MCRQPQSGVLNTAQAFVVPANQVKNLAKGISSPPIFWGSLVIFRRRRQITSSQDLFQK